MNFEFNKSSINNSRFIDVTENIKDPNDRKWVKEFLYFVLDLNSEINSVELKNTIDKRFVLIAKFPPKCDFKWISEEKNKKGLMNLAFINDKIFQDATFLHTKDGIILELFINKISSPEFVDYYIIKINTSRNDSELNFKIPNSSEINNYEHITNEHHNNTDIYIFNDIPLNFIKNFRDKIVVENFSRYARIFMEGQNIDEMKIEELPKNYKITLKYPNQTYFSWNNLGWISFIDPFLFGNLFLVHTNDHFILEILVKKSSQPYFPTREECNLTLLRLKMKRFRHLHNIVTNDHEEEEENNSHLLDSKIQPYEIEKKPKKE